METIVGIAVVFYIFWGILRYLLPYLKRRRLDMNMQPMSNGTTNTEVPAQSLTKVISKKETWKHRPEDVFKKEYISFTRIKTFETCPRMFELIYLYGFEDKSGRAGQVGRLVHKIIHLYTIHHEAYLSKKLRNSGAVEELLNFYDQAVSSTDLTYPIPRSEVRPYLSKFVALNRKDDFHVKATEYECDSVIGDYKLKCIIDRIDDGERITDYKTGNPQYAVDHQLNVYAYALSNGKWAPFQVGFQFLKTGEIRDWDYTPQLHCAAERWLLEGIEEIENTEVFRARKSGLCNYCGVFYYCDRVP